MVQAQVDVYSYRNDSQPLHLVIGPGYVDVVCKPGGEGGEFVLYLFDISRRDETKGREVHPNGLWKSAEEVEGSGWQREYSGLTRQFRSLLADPDMVWGEGDSCLRAYNPFTGQIKHTLASGGGLGSFGITENIIFKSKVKGQFATWDKANLEPQGTSKVRAWLGGDAWELIRRALLQKSRKRRGQAADGGFVVPGLNQVQHLTAVPNSSKWLCTGGSSSFAIKSFDISQPNSGSTIVGTGLGGPLAKLVTHEV